MILLKEKHDRTVKVQACVDCKKQQEGLQKNETTSPSVALELVIPISSIDAREIKDVAVVDIPGSLLAIDMDNDVIMLLQGRLVEIMVKT